MPRRPCARTSRTAQCTNRSVRARCRGSFHIRRAAEHAVALGMQGGNVLCQTLVVACAGTRRSLSPVVVTAGRDVQAPTHQPNRERVAVGEQVHAQQHHQSRQRPTEARLELQVARQQHPNERGSTAVGYSEFPAVVALGPPSARARSLFGTGSGLGAVHQRCDGTSASVGASSHATDFNRASNPEGRRCGAWNPWRYVAVAAWTSSRMHARSRSCR